MERKRQREAAARDESIQRSRNKLIHRMSVWYRPPLALLAVAVYYYANLILSTCSNLEDFIQAKVNDDTVAQTCCCALVAFLISNFFENWVLYDKVSPADEMRKLLKLISLRRISMFPKTKPSAKIQLLLLRTLLLKPITALIAATLYNLAGLLLIKQVPLEKLISVDFTFLSIIQGCSLSLNPIALLRTAINVYKLVTHLNYWTMVQTVVSVLFASLIALRLETSILDQTVKPTKETLRSDGLLKRRMED